MQWARRILPWISVVVLIAVIVDGAIFYSRWSANREILRSKAAKDFELTRANASILPGSGLKILNFYEAPGQILCYGVTGAKTVTLKPADASVWPAVSRCVQVSPQRNTEYELTAQDGAGHSVSESVSVHAGR